VFYVVTVIVALNMNLFDGVGAGMRWAIPRGITFIDAPSSSRRRTSWRCFGCRGC
jgi:hypothetical protein